MRATIKKWKRDRAVSQVVKLGKQGRLLEAAIADFEPDLHFPALEQTYEHLCGELAYVNRRRAKLIDYLKSTA